MRFKSYETSKNHGSKGPKVAWNEKQEATYSIKLGSWGKYGSPKPYCISLDGMAHNIHFHGLWLQQKDGWDHIYAMLVFAKQRQI